MKQPPPMLQFTIQTTALQKVDHMLILGVIISSVLKGNLHIRNVVITTRANGKLFLLKMLKKFNLAVEDLITIYKGCVGSLLEYAVPVWNPSIHRNHTLCRVLVLPKQSPGLLGTIPDGSPL